MDTTTRKISCQEKMFRCDKNYLDICFDVSYYSFVEAIQGEVNGMSEKGMQIMETFGKVIPTLTDAEKDRLLAFGEGMAFKAEQQRRTAETQQDSA